MNLKSSKYAQLKQSGIAFILFAFLLVASVYYTTKIYFSFNFEDFFPRGDSELDFYFTFREKFEHDDNFYLIALERKEGIFDQSFLHALDTITKTITRLPDVENVLSLSNFRNFIKSPFGYIDYPAIHIDDTTRYTDDRERILADERISGKLVNDDLTIATIILKIKDTIGQNESANLVEEIRSTLAANKITDYHMLGKAYFQVELTRLQLEEFVTYCILSVLLVAIVIFLIFRKWICVFISLLNVLISMILFLGLSGLIGIPFNALSTLYPIVIIIVGISDVIHILTGYIFELKKGNSPQDAIAITRKEIGFATFLTAITTAIGFLTLITSKVQPIREFAALSAAGVLIAYLVTFYFTANLLPFINSKKIFSDKPLKNTSWQKLIDFFYKSGKYYLKRVYIVVTVIFLLSLFGIKRISTNTHMGYGLPKQSTVKKDYDFFDQHFNGFRPFEIACIAQDTFHVTDPVIIRQIDAVEQYAKSFELVKGIQSTTLIYKSLNRANYGDKAEAYKLPDNDSLIMFYNKDIEMIAPKNINILISEDKKCGRITATLTDAGADSIKNMIGNIQQFVSDNTDTSQVKFIQTGTGIIFDRNTLYLRRNLINGLCFGFIPISFIIALFYRNWKMFIISSIPNLFPLVICGGIIGIMNIELDAATSIIFGIIYGIAVDDTIHFLSRFRQEMKKGLSKEDAIYVTFNETGKAVFTTTLILFFGFSILMISQTSATFNIGFLTAVTLFSAAISDVYLLPLLLRKFL